MASAFSRRTFVTGTAAATGAAIAVNGLGWWSGASRASALTPSGTVANLPDEFYDRPGLEGMPRIDWESLPIESVMDHGAVGDGSASDIGAFNAAVTALNAVGGGIVYIPAGTYLFGRPASGVDYWLKSALHNIHFVGEGADSVIQFERFPMVNNGDENTPRGGNGWEFNASATNISLRDFRFQWRPHIFIRHTQSSTPVLMRAPSHVQVINVEADQGQPSIWITDCSDVWVVDSVVRNSGADGIHLENAIDSVVAYNLIENTLDDGLANIAETSRLPHTEDHVNVRFVYNTVIGTHYGRGLTTGGSQVTIGHNWLEGATGSAVYLSPNTDAGTSPPGVMATVAIASNTIVRSGSMLRDDQRGLNVVSGPWTNAIACRQQISQLDIDGNRIVGSQGQDVGFGLDGWHGLTGADFTVRNNSFLNSKLFSVSALSTVAAEPVQINGLDINNNTILGGNGGSIHLAAAITGLTSLDNDVRALPVIGAGVTGDSSGFVVSTTPSDYVDAYAAIRAEPNETAASTPSAPSIAGLPSAAVTAFGADPTGATNSLQAFLDAIASLPLSGGVVRVPAGTYLIEPDSAHENFRDTKVKQHILVADRDNIHFRGAPPLSTSMGGPVLVSKLVFTSPDHHGIRFVNTQTASVECLTLELQTQPARRMNRALLEFSGVRGGSIRNLKVVNSSGPGIRVDASTGILVETNTVNGAGTYGIDLEGSRQVLATHNTIANSRDNGIEVGWGGTIAREAQYVTVMNNTVNGTREGAGIGVASGHEVSVASNSLNDTHLAGVHVYGRSPIFPIDSVTVDSNTLTNTNAGALTYTPGAISIHSIRENMGTTAGNVTVTNNTVLNTRFAGVWVGGSSTIGNVLSQIHTMTITGNTFTSVGGTNVLISTAQLAKIANLVT